MKIFAFLNHGWKVSFKKVTYAFDVILTQYWTFHGPTIIPPTMPAHNMTPPLLCCGLKLWGRFPLIDTQPLLQPSGPSRVARLSSYEQNCRKIYLHVFICPFQSLMLMNSLQSGLVTGLTFLATCFKRRHLVFFDASSLPTRLKSFLLVRHGFRTTSFFTRDKVRFEGTLDLPLSSISRIEIGDCTDFFTVR